MTSRTSRISLGTFTPGATTHSRQQRIDGEISRTHAVERRQPSAEHVIEASELAGPLDRADVRRLLDDADQRRVAPRIAADRTDVVFGEVEAARARSHALAEGDQRVCETLALLRRTASAGGT